MRPARLPWLVGASASLAVALTIAGPGITVDEPLYVRPGRRFVATLLDRGPAFFRRETVDRLFGANTDHPPLGRWLLGVASTVAEPFEGLLGGPDPFSVHAARLAPALAFGLLAGLVARAGVRLGGRAGGLAAAFALLAMPRVFAHGHLAALDTFVALTWTWALLRADRALAAPRPVLAMTLAGLVWALALLTKIHAWLLPPLVLGWAFVRLRPGRALAAFAAWAAVGLSGFVAGWPWLWFDTVGRLRAFLATGVERPAILVQYFGHIYPDHGVPWHYPWFYFAATVPVGLHALAAVGLGSGLRRRRDEPLPILLAAAVALLLLVFSTTVPVYDGERLFLAAFPPWAILAGSGFACLWRRAEGRRWLRAALVAVLLGQGWGTLSMQPFGLSYYNALVGGLPGAERLGLELTYWGDAVDPVLLDALAHHAAPGEAAALVPTLHHLQAAADTTPTLLRRGVRLLDTAAAPSVPWVVLYRRPAYWPPAVADLARTPPVAARTRQGVWLSGIWRRPESKNPPVGFEPGGPGGYNSFRRN